MSALRFMAAAVVVIIAVLCTPAALVPVFNTADIIVALSPVALFATVTRPRRRRP